jgi:UDP-N-acetylglucosamine 2-epimerase
MVTPMKVLVIFGTRPEAIKMAPVVRALGQREGIRPVVCLSGQHREMIAGILDFFGIVPDHNLSVMKPKQDLVYVTTEVLRRLQPVLALEKPDWVLVHGDTTTALAAGLSAFYAGIPIGHVEAGLRTGNLRQPWPEEMNRCVVDRIADTLFAPTARARDNLIKEHLPGDKIVVTGNTVVDALLAARTKLESEPVLRKMADSLLGFLDPNRRLILVTGHRRESFGQGFEEICAGIRLIARRTDVEIVYPLHLNPGVQVPVRRMLSNLPNVHLIEPLDYIPFVNLMMRSHIILTDSGGIQEEAPSLGKPVLVMRETTERPEALEAGTVELVGAHAKRIYDGVAGLLDSEARYKHFARTHNPYGDGLASQRICERLLGRTLTPVQQS